MTTSDLKSFLRAYGLWLAIGAAILVGGIGLAFIWHGPGGKEPVRVEIPAGSGTGQIARRLQASRGVRSGAAFRMLVLVSGHAKDLKAGEYEFMPGASMGRILQQLVNGEVVTHGVTIPEGFTARQIAERLEAAGLTSAETFMQAVEDPALARELGLPPGSLEGFLFPDTYRFSKNMTARQIAARMAAHFQEIITPDLIAAGAAQGLDLRRLITLASVIEREVREPSERAKVASVFYNRMKQRMRLESCATVLYAQGRTGGSLTWEDLETDSPYNTYRHRGLPPGPIANPGMSAIEAAAHPAQTDYLFFVVRPDGQHVFSEDFEAHKKAKWTQKRARRRSSPASAPTPAP